MTDRRASVCVIGAGSSGIAACQVLAARGTELDCFEMGSDVGGNWRYDNDNGMSSAYRSLFINTSRRMMEYASYPMPKDYPDYPHHTQIARYFDAYVDHFGLRDRITFNTEVHAGAQRRRLERHPRRRNHAQLPGRSGRKRPPLGREMAGAALPRPGVLRAFLFLSSDVVDATDNRVALYRRVVHTDWPSLYFIGLLQSLGAIMPSAELQSEWIADVLEGKVPGRRGHEARDRAPGPAHANALRGLEGHTIQVDFHPYMRVLRRERKRKRGLPRALAERSHELRLPSPAR